MAHPVATKSKDREAKAALTTQRISPVKVAQLKLKLKPRSTLLHHLSPPQMPA